MGIARVPDGNRTRVAAATERSFTTKLQAPYFLNIGLSPENVRGYRHHTYIKNLYFFEIFFNFSG